MSNSGPTVEKGAIIAIIVVVIASILLVFMAASLIDDGLEQNRERRQARRQERQEIQHIEETPQIVDSDDTQTSVIGFFTQFFGRNRETPSPTETPPPTESPPPNREELFAPQDPPIYMLPATVELFTEGFPSWRVDSSVVRNGQIYHASVEPGTGVWVHSATPNGSAIHETFLYTMELEEHERIFAFAVSDTGIYRFLTKAYHDNAVILTYHRYAAGNTVSVSTDLLDISPLEYDQLSISQGIFADDGLVVSAYTGGEGVLYLLDNDLALRGTLDVPWPSQIVQARDGRLLHIASAEPDAPQRFLLREIRIPTGSWGESLPFPVDSISFLRSADPDAGYDLHFDRYRSGTVYFYGYNFATEESTQLLRWTGVSGRIPPAYCVAFWPDGRISILKSRAYHGHTASDEPRHYQTSLTVLSPPPF